MAPNQFFYAILYFFLEALKCYLSDVRRGIKKENDK